MPKANSAPDFELFPLSSSRLGGERLALVPVGTGDIADAPGVSLFCFGERVTEGCWFDTGELCVDSEAPRVVFSFSDNATKAGGRGSVRGALEFIVNTWWSIIAGNLNIPEMKIQDQLLIGSKSESVEPRPTVRLDCGSLMKELKAPWLVVAKMGDKTLDDDA